jgi:hypothetical protein
MVHRGVGSFEVDVGDKAVPTTVHGILQGQLDVGNGPGTGFAFAESLLGFRKNLVSFGVAGGHLREHTCPELVQTISQADGAVVRQLGGVPFLVKEDCGTVKPSSGGVPYYGHALEQQEHGCVEGWWHVL